MATNRKKIMATKTTKEKIVEILNWIITIATALVVMLDKVFQ